MQCKDIPDKYILEDLYNFQGKWTMLFGNKFSTWVDNKIVERYMFGINLPDKLALRKMQNLHKRGLVGGCPCGCRGDFEITDKGLSLLGKPRLEKYNGY